jgi:hypothetical protein
MPIRSEKKLTNVSDIDGDAAVALLGRVINLAVVAELGEVPGGEDLSDGGGEGRLPVVHVPNRADVAVRLVPLEHLFFVQNATAKKE